MVIRFTPGLEGYLWLFPRRDHVGVGICAPLAQVPTQALFARLESEVARAFPALSQLDGERYAHTIPSPSEDPRSILEIGGRSFALVGDAAALADPITGEGIYFALRSGELLAAALRETGSAESYPERVLEDFGWELLKAAALRKRFYSPRLEGRMVGWSARSNALRRVLADLVMGEQGYLDLKRRLLRTLPSFLFESFLSTLPLPRLSRS
jgi:flavin-dependent dehydrogenase